MNFMTHLNKKNILNYFTLILCLRFLSYLCFIKENMKSSYLYSNIIEVCSYDSAIISKSDSPIFWSPTITTNLLSWWHGFFGRMRSGHSVSWRNRSRLLLKPLCQGRMRGKVNGRSGRQVKFRVGFRVVDQRGRLLRGSEEMMNLWTMMTTTISRIGITIIWTQQVRNVILFQKFKLS